MNKAVETAERFAEAFRAERMPSLTGADVARGVLTGEMLVMYVSRAEKLAAELADLREVVAKLPVDAEGVHCLPGDRRWAVTTERGGTRAVLCGTVSWHFEDERWDIVFGSALPGYVERGYSTEAAARAAGGE